MLEPLLAGPLLPEARLRLLQHVLLVRDPLQHLVSHLLELQGGCEHDPRVLVVARDLDLEEVHRA
eukprot:8250433-Lingulodinium_polyedra.AAC.1